MLARQNPGQYWYHLRRGWARSPHLTGEVLTRAADIECDARRTRPSSTPPAICSTAASRSVFDPSFVPYHKAGKVRTVLQEGAVRLPDLPDVPTAREAGLDLKDFRRAGAGSGYRRPRARRPKCSTAFPRRPPRRRAKPDLKEKLLGVAQIVPAPVAGRFGRQVERRQGLLRRPDPGDQHQARVGTMFYLVQVLLPLYDNDGQAFDQAVYARRSKTAFAKKFGGVTAYVRSPAEGAWHGPTGPASSPTRSSSSRSWPSVSIAAGGAKCQAARPVPSGRSSSSSAPIRSRFL